jgi:type I restriction enzyme S subunit
MQVTLTGANVTKSAMVPSSIGEAYVSPHVAMVRPVDTVTSPFLFLWIVSPEHGRAKLLADAYGAGKPGLNLDNIKEITVAMPPLLEQNEIARRVKALFKLADAIERRVAAATARADRLTQAILAKAFRGELVPTEAELARRESRPYEPASALLSRIAESRETGSRGVTNSDQQHLKARTHAKRA